ncbi:MAG: response regulator [Desulfuromonadaceae bacterium]|nr:response regulator [Desulfuromonadaceae bacterium]
MLPCRGDQSYRITHNFPISAFTLNDARTIIERQRPDLVLADFRLPDGDGSELVATVNKLCPVVLLTSQSKVQASVDAMKAGVLDYVVKTAEVFSGMSRIAKRALREWKLIQQQKQAEQGLLEANQFSEQVINCAQEGVIVYGLDLRYRAWNPVMEQISGMAASEVLGKSSFL